MSEAAIAHLPSTAVVSVLVIDLERLRCIEASASRFSESGCRIQSNRIGELHDTIGLRVDGLDQMIKARITSFCGQEADVAFEFGEGKNVDKRKERRIKVIIPARVTDRSGEKRVCCVISDASKSGCRIEGEGLHALPDDILITIEAFDIPIRGRIVWRKVDCAGVRLMWQFSNRVQFQPSAMTPAAKAKKASAGPFGLRPAR
ncbi:PilZ domain-containing protein [Polymorphum gilvum]|uniref:Type IV pilus assembly protein PilZ n=1 Tax=Polymorphum gilvum (strain LMG 25793 / CGMCC 1.9160 / SL003B-26A1) TaxID=991905 RepID=F2IZ45_POLGS|nr:PilZ domain-containing protein [Polymorphum gilvum]ADZ71768.1 Type IV pilus assembly protein PilZ [Polymorphum gilvum SL003B-26A1]